MKAIILAAGYGTRLYPLTKNKAKPLIEVAGKSMINHIMEKIKEVEEVDKVIVITNNKFYSQFVEWANNYNSNIPIKVLNDGTLSNDDRLGAIGDINFAVNKENIDDDLLIINGDNIFQFSLKEMCETFKQKNQHVISLYDVKTTEEAKKFGIVDLDETSKVIEFKEKPEQPSSTLASIGIYFYGKQIRNLISQYLAEGGNTDRTGDLVEWLHKKEHVYGFVFDKPEEKWFDIGSFESLEQANKEWNK